MIWSFIPSRARMAALVVAAISVLLAMFGRKVRQDTIKDIKLEDVNNANRIRDRVGVVRDSGVRPEDIKYRD